MRLAAVISRLMLLLTSVLPPLGCLRHSCHIASAVAACSPSVAFETFPLSGKARSQLIIAGEPMQPGKRAYVWLLRHAFRVPALRHTLLSRILALGLWQCGPPSRSVPLCRPPSGKGGEGVSGVSMCQLPFFGGGSRRKVSAVSPRMLGARPSGQIWSQLLSLDSVAMLGRMPLRWLCQAI